MGDNNELKKLLDRYFDQNVKLRSKKKTQALEIWQPVVETILGYVKQQDKRFDFRTIFGGSYYERTKTKEPNEFDIMLEIPSLSLGGWEAYDDDEDSLSTEPPMGFTAVMIDEGEEEAWKPNSCIERGNMLSATKVKSRFAYLVHEAIRKYYKPNEVSVTTSGPAVTLTIQTTTFKCSIDLTLAIKDESWPDDADEWKQRQRNGWPSQNLIREIVREGCHLVAKKPKGSTSTEADLYWRYSFSQAEKKLSTQGSSGEAGTCRRDVLRILKSLREDLKLTPLTSYHLKTIMLYEYEKYPQDYYWNDSQLAARFRSALQRLLTCLGSRNCPHYFIKNINLFDHNNFNNQRYQFLETQVRGLLEEPSRYIRI